MTLPRRISIALLFASTLLTASASTYYIDYSSGADANTGTSKLNPWKRAPGMKGFAGSSHSNPKT